MWIIEDPQRELLADRAEEVLYRALYELRPIQREVVMARFGWLTGAVLSFQDIGLLFGKRKQTVYEHYRNAVARLKELLLREIDVSVISKILEDRSYFVL